MPCGPDLGADMEIETSFSELFGRQEAESTARNIDFLGLLLLLFLLIRFRQLLRNVFRGELSQALNLFRKVF